MVMLWFVWAVKIVLVPWNKLEMSFPGISFVLLLITDYHKFSGFKQ